MDDRKLLSKRHTITIAKYKINS